VLKLEERMELVREINKIPDDIFNDLKRVIKDKSKITTQTLAGNIEEEYSLNNYIDLLEPYLLEQIFNDKVLVKFLKSFKTNSHNKPLSLKALWVNYQKKHEFNPMHDHTGVFSFIIFVKIPYLMEDQKKISPGKNSNQDLAANVQFMYLNEMGKIKFIEFPVDKTWEQKMLIFPADLHHAVYPFYGVDEERITVSGNFVFNVK
tara:strand:- start:6416 stop:7027 length:612 start_codon:yes stop_codon:yes gene_type:complete